MSLTQEQREDRLRGLTATDMAALTGQHPYRSPVNVWEEKTGRAPPFEGNVKTKWGNLLEAPVRADYSERHDLHVEVPGTLTHPKSAWRKATPDGLCYRARATEPDHGLEIKCHTLYERWRYGTPGTDEVPIYELVQSAWGMHVTGLPRWDLVLFADNVPTDYTIAADSELEASLVELGERFWRDHIQADVPPDADGSDAFGDYIKRTFSTHDAEIREVDPSVVADLRSLREQAASLKRALAEETQRLKILIGGNAGIQWRDDDGKLRKITWRESKAGRRTDWKSATAAAQERARLVSSCVQPARDLLRVLKSWTLSAKVYGHGKEDGEVECGAAVLSLTALLDSIDAIAAPDAIADFTSVTPGSRRFVVPKDWAGASADESNEDKSA